MTTQSSVMSGENRRRTVLKDNSWIRRDPEEDELVDNDPNFGKVVLGQVKPVENVHSKPVETNQTPVNSGTAVSSLSKRFGGSQELLNKSSTNTKSAVGIPSSPAKPPVPAKNPVLKTSPNTSGFTARVFSANTSGKSLSPVKSLFGEKFPEVTASQTANGLDKTSITGSTPSSVTVSSSSSSSSSSAASVTTASTSVKSSAATTPVNQTEKSTNRSESVSVSTRVSTSSSPSAGTTITNTKTSALEETSTPKPVEKPLVSPKMRDVNYTPTRWPSSDVTPSTRYSYRSDSAPLEDLVDTLLPSLSTSVESQPVRSQVQVKSVYSEISVTFPTPRSPLQTLDASGRTVSSRDICTVCGKPIAGGERMILEELKIMSHTSCFRCAVCHCDLGRLEAGKSLWVHRERVNCSSCYSKTRAQWYI